MLINEKEISTYGGVFVSFTYEGSEYTSNLMNLGLSHLNSPADMTPSTRNLNIVFTEQVGISNLYSELGKGAIIDLDDGFIYDCYLLSTPAVTHLGNGVYDVIFAMSTICKGFLEYVSDTFIVKGNYKCGAIYEVTSTQDMTDVTIDGYQIKAMKAGKTLILDGIDKLVYYKDTPNTSAFDDTILTTFPCLEPGEHTVEKPVGIDVGIRYYPLYL